MVAPTKHYPLSPHSDTSSDQRSWTILTDLHNRPCYSLERKTRRAYSIPFERTRRTKSSGAYGVENPGNRLCQRTSPPRSRQGSCGATASTQIPCSTFHLQLSVRRPRQTHIFRDPLEPVSRLWE